MKKIIHIIKSFKTIDSTKVTKIMNRIVILAFIYFVCIFLYYVFLNIFRPY